jgi:hypothetical protein
VPRPTFEPDDEQKAVLDAIKKLAEQRRTIEERLDQLTAKAEKLKIPIKWIADAAGRTRKTVYRHLGKPMK